VPFITDALKCYTFTVRLGEATNTDDAEGEVISTSDLRPTDAEIKEALGAFVGDVMQVPPQFSAVKIDGVRAYKKARDGEEMTLAARELWVEALIMLERVDADHVVLEMTCGKGGYVRSIARDLGAALGCYGHVLTLRRIWSGPFDVADAVTLDQVDALAKTPELDGFIQPLEIGLADLEQVTCPAASLTKLRNGNAATVFASGLEYDQEVWASHEGQAVAVGHYRSGELHPSRVFVRPE
jgi:tRNA pseudouridine55 synthase